jgi:hypothetical protein
VRTMVRSATAILAVCVACSLFAAGHELTPSPPAANQLLPVVTGSGSGFTAAWYEPALSRYRMVSSVVNAIGTITIYAAVGSLVRIRAFGPGGFSEGTITSIGSMPRRRAARR